MLDVDVVVLQCFDFQYSCKHVDESFCSSIKYKGIGEKRKMSRTQ